MDDPQLGTGEQCPLADDAKAEPQRVFVDARQPADPKSDRYGPHGPGGAAVVTGDLDDAAGDREFVHNITSHGDSPMFRVPACGDDPVRRHIDSTRVYGIRGRQRLFGGIVID